jgi:hypothetical protein
MALKELERVVQLVDKPEQGLRAGDVGVVVHVYENGQGYEVKFFTADGETISVETLAADEVAAPKSDQILHVRPLTTA